VFRRAAVVLLVVVGGGAARLGAQAPPCGSAAGAGMSADSLVALGRFWQAERAAPRLPSPPRAVRADLAILHARIRTGLERWVDVEEVLARVPGADSMPEALLLRALAAERLENWGPAESRYRRLADNSAVASEVRDAALVRRAVALGRLGRLDSAGAAWRRAAQALPEIADWLAIRRAGTERDTSLAFASVAAPRSYGARQRSEALIAQRRLTAGNLRGALETYRRLGSSLNQARIELALGQRRAARLRADSLLLQDPTRPQVPLAANFLVDHYDSLTVREILGVSRAYRSVRDQNQAERQLLRGLQRSDSSVALWLELAGLRSEQRRLGAALAAVDSAAVHSRRRPSTLVGLARVTILSAARQWVEADSVATRLARAFPGDSNAAKAVLAMAEHDRALVQSARELQRYRLLLRRFPLTPAANVARFRMALFLYVRGAVDTAAAVLADVIGRDTANLLGTAPRYWDARLSLERGDSSGRLVLARIAAGEPLSYYGVRSRELGGDTTDFFAETGLAPPRPGSFAPARARERIRLLAGVGLEDEARAEALGWLGDTTASVQLLVAAAEAAGAAGYVREAIRLGEAAQARTAVTLGMARGLFPFPYRAAIEGAGLSHCVDPLLLAAIVRQETRFTRRAVSRAGARGIAQVLPATGRQLAQRLRIRDFDPDLLFVADLNLFLGARYLADRFDRDSFPVYAAIASYNAGPQRVDRWRRWPEFRDQDLFVERVAIPETRNYVKSVYANYQWYRHTYRSAAAGAPSAGAQPSGPSSLRSP